MRTKPIRHTFRLSVIALCMVMLLAGDSFIVYPAYFESWGKPSAKHDKATNDCKWSADKFVLSNDLLSSSNEDAENTKATSQALPYEEKIIEVPFISQLPEFPTGCESVSTVMALNYLGIDISVDTFIDQYLNTSSGVPFDPSVTFGGDPRSESGYGCYTPVIREALDQILAEMPYSAKVLSGLSITELCTEYIDNDIPVIFWATQDMAAPVTGSTWIYEGTTIQWISPMHCLLLVGYNEEYYIFNDPLKSEPLTYYSKEAVEAAYEGLFQQAIVVIEK